ncbi:hypothetical protein [Dyadobacter sp. 676]|uniref:Uncharacterized protein n=1 Tax=Dyadobacter sp. 676 TaxID=3088362 RepID=A0AAU8FR93_9BACT
MSTRKFDKPARTLYQRLRSDNNAIEKYFKGKYTLEQLHERGIQFVKPV